MDAVFSRFSRFKILARFRLPFFYFVRKIYFSKCSKIIALSDYVFFIKFTGLYIAKFLTFKQKLMIQHNHYAFLIRISDNNDSLFCIKKGVVIWTQENNACASKQSIILRISDLTKFEGELVLEYFFNDTLLYLITFTFAPGAIISSPYEQLILIGGSQGRQNNTKLIREASKLNGEISPSTALILALKAISKVLGIKTILGIKVSHHISSEMNQNAGYFSYDDLWIKNHGKEYSKYYVIPTLLQNISDPIEGTHKSRTKKKRARKEEMTSHIMREVGRYISLEELQKKPSEVTNMSTFSCRTKRSDPVSAPD